MILDKSYLIYSAIQNDRLKWFVRITLFEYDAKEHYSHQVHCDEQGFFTKAEACQYISNLPEEEVKGVNK
jgi:hypothetical protein